MPQSAFQRLEQPCVWRVLLLVAAAAGGLCGIARADDELPLTGPPQATPGPAPASNAALKPLPGVEINYDLLAAPGSSTGPVRLQGLVSGAHGNLLTSVLVNPAAAEGERVARLDTHWQTHRPNILQTLVVGDTVASGGGWSRAVRFGGLRFGRGVSVRQLPGPEVATGQLSVVAPGPLPAGASDYEVEAGRLRTGWGMADTHYGEGYAGAAYRQGLGAGLTAETRAEWTRSRVAAGFELSGDAGSAGTVRAVVAQSAGAERSGLRWGMGFVGNAEGGTWSLTWDGFERGYRQLAAVPGEADPRGRVQVGASLPLWGRASAGLTYSRQVGWEAPAVAAVGLVASVPLAERSRLSLTYSQRAGEQPGVQVGLTLPLP